MALLGAGLVAAMVLLVGGRRRPRPGASPAGTRTGGGGRHVRSGSSRAPSWRVSGGALAFLALVALGWREAMALVVAGAALGCARTVQRRGAERRTRQSVARALPDLIELLRIAAAAGHPVVNAIAVVAPRAPVVLRPPMATASAGLARGLPLSEVLDGLGRSLGPDASSLLASLDRSAATGVPLAPMLDRVAGEAGDQRRRRAQEHARRLPVTLLLPLAGCILPAAVLLAIAPVLFVSIAELARP